MKNGVSVNSEDLALIREAVFKKTTFNFDERSLKISGYNFDNGVKWDQIFQSFLQTGFQATNFGLAIQEINKMISAREFIYGSVSPPTKPKSPRSNLKNYTALDYISETFAEDYMVCGCKPPSVNRKCIIFLSYTSNLVSCGVRDVIRYLVQHHMVDVLVTTAGGIEEDLIKCLAPTFLGDFDLPGKDLRAKGMNRIGNLIIPNENYCKFEDWILPILDRMLQEQNELGKNWTPSKMISRFGHEIKDPSSILYWAHRNNIPVFCPALTDGSIGDMLYFHSYKNPGLKLDIIEDVRRINNVAIRGASKTGVLILGGGVIKHHTMNANMMRNGADYSVYINSCQEFDGSDSGADPDEALSWGKIKSTPNDGPATQQQPLNGVGSNETKVDLNLSGHIKTIVDKTRAGVPVKVFADASLIFPFIVAATFAANHHDSPPEAAKQSN